MENKTCLRTAFSTNWNNKLLLNCFTTIRFSDRFAVGQEHEIFLKDRLLGLATVVDVTRYASIQAVPESVCFTDTGYNRINTSGIIAKMYPSDPNATRKPVYVVTFEWSEGSHTSAHQALFVRAEQLSLF